MGSLLGLIGLGPDQLLGSIPYELASQNSHLVPVVVRLVRTFNGNVEIFGLLFRQLCEAGT